MNEIEILSELDDSNPSKCFIDLEHIYYYTMGNRINLFADDSRWVIAFEKTFFNPRDNYVGVEVNYFGNCMIDLDINNGAEFNTKWFPIVLPEDIDAVVNDQAKNIKVRDQLVRFKDTLINVATKHDELDFPLFIRLLDEQVPEIFRATNEELYASIPSDLDKIFAIDHWHYKPYFFYDSPVSGSKPSSYETFQLIAKILVEQDSTLWNPILEPNNNWRNYPLAGTH